MEIIQSPLLVSPCCSYFYSSLLLLTYLFAGLSKHLPVFLLGTENIVVVGGDSGSGLW